MISIKVHMNYNQLITPLEHKIPVISFIIKTKKEAVRI